MLNLSLPHLIMNVFITFLVLRNKCQTRTNVPGCHEIVTYFMSLSHQKVMIIWVRTLPKTLFAENDHNEDIQRRW